MATELLVPARVCATICRVRRRMTGYGWVRRRWPPCAGLYPDFRKWPSQLSHLHRLRRPDRRCDRILSATAVARRLVGIKASAARACKGWHATGLELRATGLELRAGRAISSKERAARVEEAAGVEADALARPLQRAGAVPHALRSNIPHYRSLVDHRNAARTLVSTFCGYGPGSSLRNRK